GAVYEPWASPAMLSFSISDRCGGLLVSASHSNLQTCPSGCPQLVTASGKSSSWIKDRNAVIEVRWGGEGRSERFAEIAAMFVRLKVGPRCCGLNRPNTSRKTGCAARRDWSLRGR